MKYKTLINLLAVRKTKQRNKEWLDLNHNCVFLFHSISTLCSLPADVFNTDEFQRGGREQD